MKKEDDDTLSLVMKDDQKMTGVNCLLWAVGRAPNTDTIGVDKLVS